jgi:hypothetical protein
MNHFDLLCQYDGFEADELYKGDDNQDFLSLVGDGYDDMSHFDNIPTTENNDYFIQCDLESKYTELLNK